MNILNFLSTTWQFWAFLSALAAALTAVFAKVGVKDVPPDVATFVRTVVILAFVAAMLLVTNQFNQLKLLSSRAATFLILSGLATGASWICYFRALNIGKASQVAAIDKLSVVLVAVIALIFLKERLNASEVCGILMITGGAILIARA